MNARQVLRIAGLSAVVLSASGGCVIDVLDAQTRAEGAFDRMLVVNGPVDLDVRTGAGSVQILTGPVDNVRVIGHIRGSESFFRRKAEERIKQIEAAPPIEQNGNAIRIGETKTDPRFRNVRISYELTVPEDTRLRSRSGSGDQVIGSVRGPIDVGTGSGSIRVAQTRGDVQASTGSGDIDLERTDGSFIARAGSGSIKAASVAGTVKARTGSGRVEIAQTAEADVDVTAGSGSIAITGARAMLRAHTGSGSIVVEGEPMQNWDLQAGSGDITVGLGSQAAFDLNARTGSGAIETNHPLTVLGVVTRLHLQGSVRGGGAKVDVSTGSGSIRIR